MFSRAYRSIAGFVVLSERWKEGRWVKKTPSCFHPSAFYGVAGDCHDTSTIIRLALHRKWQFSALRDNIIYVCEDL